MSLRPKRRFSVPSDSLSKEFRDLANWGDYVAHDLSSPRHQRKTRCSFTEYCRFYVEEEDEASPSDAEEERLLWARIRQQARKADGLIVSGFRKDAFSRNDRHHTLLLMLYSYLNAPVPFHINATCLFQCWVCTDIPQKESDNLHKKINDLSTEQAARIGSYFHRDYATNVLGI
jgi:hypothetical protein